METDAILKCLAATVITSFDLRSTSVTGTSNEEIYYEGVFLNFECFNKMNTYELKQRIKQNEMTFNRCELPTSIVGMVRLRLCLAGLVAQLAEIIV